MTTKVKSVQTTEAEIRVKVSKTEDIGDSQLRTAVEAFLKENSLTTQEIYQTNNGAAVLISAVKNNPIISIIVSDRDWAVPTKGVFWKLQLPETLIGNQNFFAGIMQTDIQPQEATNTSVIEYLGRYITLRKDFVAVQTTTPITTYNDGAAKLITI